MKLFRLLKMRQKQLFRGVLKRGVPPVAASDETNKT